MTTWVPIGSGEAKLHDSRGVPRLRIPAGWRGLPVELLRIRGTGENSCRFAAEPALLVSRSGSGRRWYRSGTVIRDLDSQPGMFDVYGADHEYDHARWEGLEGECIAIWFSRPLIGGLLRPEARQLEWTTRQAATDASGGERPSGFARMSLRTSRRQPLSRFRTPSTPSNTAP